MKLIRILGLLWASMPALGFGCDGVELFLPSNPTGLDLDSEYYKITYSGWFNDRLPRDSAREDVEYLLKAGLDPKETMARIGDRMSLFVWTMSNLRKANGYAKVTHFEFGPYDIEDVTTNPYHLHSCPYIDFLWPSSTELLVRHRSSKTVVRVNHGTAHLAKEHLLLNKGFGNAFKTSAQIFLKYFMEPVPETK